MQLLRSILGVLSRLPRNVLAFAKRRPWRTAIIVIVLLAVLGIVWKATRPAKPEYVTAVAARGDLRQTVEAVGTILSERDMRLQFPVSGIVAQVFVKEGDSVKSGQKLVTLRSGNLSASVAAAYADLQQAQAQLDLMVEGTRPEDITIAEAELRNKQASLQAARASLATSKEQMTASEEKLKRLHSEADTSLSGDVLKAGSTVSAELVDMRSALEVIEDVYDDVDVQDVLLKYNASEYSFLVSKVAEARDTITDVQQSDMSPDNYEEAIALLQKARQASTLASTALTKAYDVIVGLPQTGVFSQSDREAHKSTLSTKKAAVQTATTNLDAELTSLRDGSASYDTKIANEEASLISARGSYERADADIRTYETAVQISQAQLELKRAGSRPADIQAAQARVSSARASLLRAQAQLNDTVLIAPIDGVITKVNVKAGESLSTSFQTDEPITMLGKSPFRVEMYVAEVDIPKVMLTQTGSIELDAFRGTPFTLHVSEIDPVSTDRDGVPKYRVKLDFDTEPVGIKVGMTGDAEIVTDVRRDVVSIPLRAILERADGSAYTRVLKNDVVEERTVTLGIDGEGGAVQVAEVGSGETIVVLIRE